MAGALLLAMAWLLGGRAGTAPVAAPPGVPPAPTAGQLRTDALPTPQFRRYGTDDGLPSTNVYAVAQGPDGAMWFGTKGGIARFDGVRFSVFRHREGDSGSLYDDGISSLLIDRRGRLWAGGLNAGLNRYDAATGKFVHWGHDPADPHSLSSDRVWAMAQDADGRLWVGTANGLDRMRADGRGFDRVAAASLPGGFGTVAALYADPRGRLWIGSSRGVFRRDADGTLHPVPLAGGGSSRPIDAWRIDGDGGEVRIAAAGGLLIVGRDGLAHRFGAPTIPETNVMASTRDPAGRLWVGTQKGLFVQMTPGGPVTRVTDRPVLYGNLPGTWVWQILSDREGGLWVTLLDGGVAYLAPDWNNVDRFTHIPDDPSSLRDAVATTVARDIDGRHVWVGERQGRVDRLDPVTGQVDHAISGLDGDVVGMTEDARHRLWVTVQGALYVCSGQRGGKCVPVDMEKAGTDQPLEVEPGPDGQMYARSFGQGVFRIDPDTLAVSRVPMERPTAKVLWGSQMTLAHGVFWYASDGGMMRLDAAHRRLEMVPGGPMGESVDAFDFDADGLWMANANGLTHYRYRGDGLLADRRVDAAHGWPSVNVVNLHVDDRGRVWVFGRDGLWRYDPGSGAFRSFGLQDGLANGEFSRGFALLPGGYIYAPTLGGVAAFDPARVRDDWGRPQLALTRVSVRRRHAWHLLPVTPGGTVHVGWRDAQLTVQARAFSYIDPVASHYLFRLHGFDNGWVDTGSRGEREFVGLHGGDYTLDVRVDLGNGHWATLAAPLHVAVQAPPWLRWWAWLIYVALLAGAVWMLLQAWRRRIAHRHQVQLAEQQRQLAEQASAAKSQFLATLSHEIRTPMTGVMGMAELLLDTPLTPTQHSYAETMQRSGGLLLKLLNDALDLARIESGRLELEPAPFDPCALVQEVGRLQTGQARAKGLRFDVEIETELPPRTLGDVFRVRQILLNLTNNALKFTAHGRVMLTVGCRGDELVFGVSDTGPGIPADAQARLFEPFEQGSSPERRAGTGLGLAICRELAALMGGRITLASRLGEGSTFRLHLPLQALDMPGPAPLLPDGGPRGAVPRDLLLVEDDTIVAAVIRGLLERQGHTVRHATNGLEAMAELARAPCDAVLLDLDLPGLDGFRVARLIRQNQPPDRHLPIIAITARTGSDDEARSREAGMDGFLRKPLTGAQLAAALAEWTTAEAVA